MLNKLNLWVVLVALVAVWGCSSQPNELVGHWIEGANRLNYTELVLYPDGRAEFNIRQRGRKLENDVHWKKSGEFLVLEGDSLSGGNLSLKIVRLDEDDLSLEDPDGRTKHFKLMK